MMTNNITPHYKPLTSGCIVRLFVFT